MVPSNRESGPVPEEEKLFPPLPETQELAEDRVALQEKEVIDDIFRQTWERIKESNYFGPKEKEKLHEILTQLIEAPYDMEVAQAASSRLCQFSREVFSERPASIDFNFVKFLMKLETLGLTVEGNISESEYQERKEKLERYYRDRGEDPSIFYDYQRLEQERKGALISNKCIGYLFGM